MAWSAKIKSGSGGTQDVNEFQLVYDPSTQSNLLLDYGFSLGNDAPNVLFHTPDDGPPVPVRANDNNKLIFLTLTVNTQSDFNAVINQITPIARLIDGSDSQAIRYWTNGDVNKVSVEIIPDSDSGSYTTTYFDVLHGFIDTSQAFSSEYSDTNTIAYKLTVALTCTPLGYGDSFTLNNALASSPHFLEDSNSDGLADGLTTSTVGSATYTISSNAGWIGGKAQKLTTDNSNTQGFYFSVTASISSTCVVKVLIAAQAGSDPVTMLLTDGAGTTITSKQLDISSPADFEATTIAGDTGLTRYEYNLSGTNSGAANFRIYIRRWNTDASAVSNYWVDAIYLQTDTTTAPPAFMSSNAIYNRNDPETNTAYINYVDVWGIPGDAPALVTTHSFVTSSTTNAKAFTFATRSDGVALAASLPHYIDSSEFTIAGSSWSTTVDASRIGGSYISCGLPTATYRAIGSVPKRLLDRSLRIYAYCYITTAVPSLEMGVGGVDKLAGAPSATGTWSLVDMGLLNAGGRYPSDTISTSAVEFDVDAIGASGTVRLDGVLLLPTDQFIVHKSADLASSNADIYIDGTNGQVFTEISDGTLFLSPGSTIETLEPGSIMNRIIFVHYASTSSNEVHAITTTAQITLTVTPRTRHLLGTK